MAGCVAMFSGGLDSTLALRMMTAQGVETVAFYAENCFHGADDVDAKIARLRERALALGAADFVVRDLTDPLIALVKAPRYGLGRNMNPCLDCRIRTLAEADAVRRERGLDFIVSGEVLGQRPMSQRRDAMRTVERHAREMGLEGLLLRPLCAQLLEPTIPERRGWVDRGKLAGMSGRGRNPQLALALALGVDDFPSPAGGCLLTDPGYALRLRELNKAHPPWTAADAELLKIGRHYRPVPGWRVVASRKAEENEKMKSILPAGAHVFVTDGKPGAMVAAWPEGPAGPEGGEAADALAAGLAVYYSKFRAAGRASIATWTHGVADSRRVLPEVAVIDPATVSARYIGVPQGAAAKSAGGE